MMKKIIFIIIFSLLICIQIVTAQTNLNEIFIDQGLKGSITIYDLKNNKWFFSNKEDSLIESLPASTFKIMNSLIALQENVIKQNEVLKWDGKTKKFKGDIIQAWNMDTDIENAFKNSTIWFYVELAKKIERKKYRKYLQKASYGNLKISEKGADFWNYGEFAVSPKNQIDFLLKLHKNDLPFSEENMEYVKSIMIQQKTDNYTIRGKTGWGIKDNQEIGWYIGYIETKENTYFFATRIISNTEKMPSTFASSRKSITMTALKKLKFIE